MVGKSGLISQMKETNWGMFIDKHNFDKIRETNRVLRWGLAGFGGGWVGGV